MNDSAAPEMMPFLGVAALLAWVAYSRIRRMVGRQLLRPYRPWLTVVLFSTLIGLMTLTSLPRPLNTLALIGGVASGAALAIYGLRLTRFEQTESGLFYTPNAHLGIVLSLLFIGRIAYRAYQLQQASALATAQPADFVQSPLTLAIFGMLAGYYVSYAIGLIRSPRRLTKTADPDFLEQR